MRYNKNIQVIFFMDHLQQFESKLKKTAETFQSEIKLIKPGHASPALIEDIEVSCYDQIMKLKQIAAISSPSPKELIIQPWDKTLTQSIVKAVSDGISGLQVIPDKNYIRVSFPPLTEERRKEFVKLLRGLAEEVKINMRKERDEINKTLEKEIIAEDERFRKKEKVDDLIKAKQKEIELLVMQKEKELLAI